MVWASQALEKFGIEATRANKILRSLSAGHDVVLCLEGSLSWDEIETVLDKVALAIEQGVDLDHDWSPDLTRKQLIEKTKKVMELMVKKWVLLQNNNNFRINNATYFDPSAWKVLKDSRLSNQWLFTWSPIQDYQEEHNSGTQIVSKKLKIYGPVLLITFLMRSTNT